MVRSSELQAKPEDLDLILRERRHPSFGHVKHSSEQSEQHVIYRLMADRGGGAGRPKLTWKKLREKDWREWKLKTVDPQERSTWRSGVRSAIDSCS